MAASDPLPRRYRWYGLGLLVVLVGLVAWMAWPRWSSVRIQSVRADGTRLVVLNNACGDLRVDVDENADEVGIVLSVRDEPNVDCGGSEVRVVLEEPLGDRRLIDGYDGAVLHCVPPGAASQQCLR